MASTLDLVVTAQRFNNYQGFPAERAVLEPDPHGLSSGSGAAIFIRPAAARSGSRPAPSSTLTGKITSTGDGGYVALLADGGVSNAGSITHPQNRQIILASDSSIP